MPSNDDHASGSSQWRSIRPWTPSLSLSVREITSVSVTFIMSSNLSDRDIPPLAALGLIVDEENPLKTPVDESDSSQPIKPKRKSIISDALAKGLSVDVNGSPWQRVFIRIEDGADEAVIIIYGLMPGREYDVQLGLVHGLADGPIRQQVLTSDNDDEPLEASNDTDSPDADQSTSSSDPQVSTPSTSPSRTLPNTPPSTTVPLTIEDRLNQLHQTLSVIHAERDSLSTALKVARRDAQKADAALRSEIDTLKRASEKHVAADHRAKQKILSLQEAVKRAQTATRETELLVKEIEQLEPQLNKQKLAKELEYTQLKEQADRAQLDREREAEKDRKKLESMKNELAGLTNKMERLNAKKEKLEGNTITDLEEQLKSVLAEIAEAQKEEQAQLTYAMFLDRTDMLSNEPPYPDSETITDRSPAFPYLSTKRLRPQISNPVGPIERPVPSSQTQPIQRPGQQNGLWNTESRQHQRSSSQHAMTPIILTNPLRNPTKTTAVPPSNTTLNSANNPSFTSTLSSRAPAFEPGRPIQASTDATSNPSAPIPIQRPHAGYTGPRAPGSNLPAKTKTRTNQGPRAST
ncbi:hypothetical protein H0H93_006451 [Arthromyces matolae]|nr:hypothetical protein H0H93_006451 [Arthromyces matolae]